VPDGYLHKHHDKHIGLGIGTIVCHGHCSSGWRFFLMPQYIGRQGSFLNPRAGEARLCEAPPVT
jgi:hypothetical protein